LINFNDIHTLFPLISYDYIFTGTGVSGLMTAYRMSLDVWFDDKNILLIDRDIKMSNDKTWCYWEQGEGEWDDILTQKWHNIDFGSPGFLKSIPLGDYSYKMVRSKDLYTFLWQEVHKKKNITRVVEDVLSFEDQGNCTIINTNRASYKGTKLINSIFNPAILSAQTKYHYLKQHFVGWYIHTEESAFDESKATFMDFDIAQHGNTRFMYLLPLSSHDALVEYTLFSSELLDHKEYEAEIIKYLDDIGVKNYTITEKESGNIPMTCYPFYKNNTANILHIGSAGGWTKASTGYTFSNTGRQTKSLIAFLKNEGDLRKFYKPGRHWWYDLIFLDVLYRHNEAGSQIFTSIFKNNKIKNVFNFLDEKSSLWTDIRIMTKTKPTFLFIKSAVRCIFTLLRNQ
jgi:lycopene beta-cyclase